MKRSNENLENEMTNAAERKEGKPGKNGKKSAMLMLALATIGAGGGFFAVAEGIIPVGEYVSKDSSMDESPKQNTDEPRSGQATDTETSMVSLDEIAFIEVDPITISLDAGQTLRLLRFRAQLEVNANYEREVSQLLPRVTDVLNSYLRALELSDLTGPLALVRLRSQMLRRIQVVVGSNRVRDLLVMEFVLN